MLLFGKGERARVEDYRLQLEALCHLDTDEQRMIRTGLDGIVLKHEAVQPISHTA